MGRLKRMAAALAVLAVIAATIFIVAKLLQPGYVELRSYSDDAGGLPEGSVVRLNGITIGELDRLRLTGAQDPNRKVEFVMKVKSRYLREIPEDSAVGVASTNLLGGEFLNIVRGKSTRPIEPGAELRSAQALDPQKLLAQMGNELQQIDSILARANKLLDDVSAGKGNIGKWSTEGLKNFSAVSVELERLTNDVRNGHGNLSKIGDLSDQVAATQKRLDDLIAGYQAGQGTLGKLQNFSKEIDGLTQEFQRLTTDLNGKTGPSTRLAEVQKRIDELMLKVDATTNRISAGQGTLGRLTVNPQFSSALSNTTTEFQTLARDIRANPRKFLHLTVRLF